MVNLKLILEWNQDVFVQRFSTNASFISDLDFDRILIFRIEICYNKYLLYI